MADPPISTLAARIRAGTLSPVALLEGCLARIADWDGALGAFVHLNPDARAAAEHAQREVGAGRWNGPLHGVPIAIDDACAAADMPTGDDWPDADAAPVARLRAQGAVLIGKTRTPGAAARNPRNAERAAGSGAGAAVAAGFAIAALGAGGSGAIRTAAGLCGCVGLKPTFGLVGRAGIAPLAWSLDHAGVLAASVADAALVAAAISGPDPADPGSADRPPADWSAALAAGASGLTLGVCRNHFFDDVDTAVGSAVETAIRKLAGAGAQVVEFEVPELAAANGAALAIELASAAALADPGKPPDLRAAMGRLITATDYLQAERYRHRLGERFAAVFEEIDAVLTPTLPRTAWPVDAPAADTARLAHPWTLLGLPALTVPCGTDAAGLPISLQIAAAPFAEATAFRTAAALEALLGGPMPRAEG